MTITAKVDLRRRRVAESEKKLVLRQIDRYLSYVGDKRANLSKAKGFFDGVFLIPTTLTHDHTFAHPLDFLTFKHSHPLKLIAGRPPHQP